MKTPTQTIIPPFEYESMDVKLLLQTMMALKKGDFSVRLPIEDGQAPAEKSRITFNSVVEMNERMANELERLRQAVAKEGKINQRAIIGDFGGSWAQMMESVNTLIDELLRPTSEMSRVWVLSERSRKGICPKPRLWKWADGLSKGNSYSLPKRSIPWWTNCGPLPRK